MTPSQPIYLDHNATTPISAEVAAAMAECYRRGYVNPASQHRPGRAALARLDEAREEIGRLLGAQVSGTRPDRVLLTSGGTEANNLALLGMAGRRAAGQLLISAIEHPSIVGPAETLRRRGWQVTQLPVDSAGVARLDVFENLLAEQGAELVSVMLANNETGVLQPVAQIAECCRAAGIAVHTDAVQMPGKLPVNFQALGVTAMTVAAHKFQGPRGIGALILTPEVRLEPLLHGGSQQGDLRPGTEDVALAVGMQTALALWQAEATARAQRMQQLRNQFESELRRRVPEMVIIGEAAERLPQTSCLAFPGCNRQAVFMALDLANVACSTGSACASGASDPSPTLLAMGLPEETVEGALRFSLGAETTPQAITEAVERISLVINNLRRR